MAYIKGISLEGLLITRYNTPYRGAPPNKKKEALVGCAEQAVNMKASGQAPYIALIAAMAPPATSATAASVALGR